MKTTLSLTALALLVTTLIAPMQASAANRQISIKPKFKAFSVQTTPENQSVEVANTTRDEPRRKVSPKAFRVNNDQPVFDVPDDRADASPPTNNNPPKRVKTQRFRVDNSEPAFGVPDDSADASPPPRNKPPKRVKTQEFRVDNAQPQFVVPDDNADASPTPKKKKSLRFRVKEQSEQAIVAPIQDEETEFAVTEQERPAKKLAKLVKKAPVAVEEAAPDDEDNQTEATVAPTVEAETESDDQQIMAQLFAEVKRRKHQVVVEDSYNQYDDVGYEQDYTGSSCQNNSNNY